LFADLQLSLSKEEFPKITSALPPAGILPLVKEERVVEEELRDVIITLSGREERLSSSSKYSCFGMHEFRLLLKFIKLTGIVEVGSRLF